MTENVENMILEHLRHIRVRVDRIAEDIGLRRHREKNQKTQVTQ